MISPGMSGMSLSVPLLPLVHLYVGTQTSGTSSQFYTILEHKLLTAFLIYLLLLRVSHRYLLFFFLDIIHIIAHPQHPDSRGRRL